MQKKEFVNLKQVIRNYQVRGTKRKNTGEKNCLRDLKDTIKWNNTCIMGVLEEEKRNKKASILKKKQTTSVCS